MWTRNPERKYKTEWSQTLQQKGTALKKAVKRALLHYRNKGTHLLRQFGPSSKTRASPISSIVVVLSNSGGGMDPNTLELGQEAT